VLLFMAITREIKMKGKNSRFKKVEKGRLAVQVMDPIAPNHVPLAGPFLWKKEKQSFG